MVRWPIATSCAAAAAACVVWVSSCSSFGESAEATDASADAAARADAACSPLVDLTFEGSTFPGGSFTISSSPDGGTVSRSAAGAGGSAGALMITLDVPATGENPYAYIQRRFDVAPAELDLSFDFTAPVVPPLYAIVGCGLTFRPPEPSMARTELKFTVSDGTGPVLETVSVPGAGPKRSAPLDDPGSAFHSVALRVTVATDGRGNAHYRMGASEGDFDFLVREPSASVTLTCGSYADSAAGTYTFLVDNVRLGICKTRP